MKHIGVPLLLPRSDGGGGGGGRIWWEGGGGASSAAIQCARRPIASPALLDLLHACPPPAARDLSRIPDHAATPADFLPLTPKPSSGSPFYGENWYNSAAANPSSSFLLAIVAGGPFNTHRGTVLLKMEDMNMDLSNHVTACKREITGVHRLRGPRGGSLGASQEGKEARCSGGFDEDVVAPKEGDDLVPSRKKERDLLPEREVDEATRQGGGRPSEMVLRAGKRRARNSNTSGGGG
ncbi:hypothetical protein E2562_005120 [Oryza meyeriana var. granulata]|uniref:Uncharacterized protein n=1 Tax=Oryza meyeriana var. granulata TaxID=110450 RepID=A0A6G1BT30_9ORYZ|nr:hypothetical protein E2562_005120 [Oryza meyeriana var. granulata]